MECPACCSTKVVASTPITRTTKAGARQVIALRSKCEKCGYADRNANFKGALSLNNIDTEELDRRDEED